MNSSRTNNTFPLRSDPFKEEKLQLEKAKQSLSLQVETLEAEFFTLTEEQAKRWHKLKENREKYFYPTPINKIIFPDEDKNVKQKLEKLQSTFTEMTIKLDLIDKKLKSFPPIPVQQFAELRKKFFDMPDEWKHSKTEQVRIFQANNDRAAFYESTLRDIYHISILPNGIFHGYKDHLFPILTAEEPDFTKTMHTLGLAHYLNLNREFDIHEITRELTDKQINNLIDLANEKIKPENQHPLPNRKIPKWFDNTAIFKWVSEVKSALVKYEESAYSLYPSPGNFLNFYVKIKKLEAYTESLQNIPESILIAFKEIIKFADEEIKYIEHTKQDLIEAQSKITKENLSFEPKILFDDLEYKIKEINKKVKANKNQLVNQAKSNLLSSYDNYLRQYNYDTDPTNLLDLITAAEKKFLDEIEHHKNSALRQVNGEEKPELETSRLFANHTRVKFFPLIQRIKEFATEEVRAHHPSKNVTIYPF